MKKAISQEMSEILGLLCSEGCHVKSFNSFWGFERGKPRYYKNHKQERIEFYNKDNKLLVHFRNLLKLEFGYAPNITKNNKINICNRKIIRSIINLTELGHLKWKIPSKIMNSNSEVRIKFLRGFFDGDGTASNRARIFSTNRNGTNQLSKLLNSININHTIQGPIIKEMRKPAYIIQISEKHKETFLNLIKPISKRPGKFMRG